MRRFGRIGLGWWLGAAVVAWLAAAPAVTPAAAPPTAAPPAAAPAGAPAAARPPTPPLDGKAEALLRFRAAEAGRRALPGASGVDAGRLGPLDEPPPEYYPPADSNPPYDALHYELHLDLDPAAALFSGRARIDALVLHAGLDTLRLNYAGPAITAVHEGETVRTYRWARDTLSVSLGYPRAAGDTVFVTVEYAGTETRGFHFPDPRLPESPATYTFSEPEDARYWFPCRDVPDDKATVDLYVTVPEGQVVGSNGELMRESAAGPGKREFHWREINPIATYLVCVNAAPYAVLHDDRLPGTPIVHYVYPADSLAAVSTFNQVPAMIEHFSGLFGPYPFNKYGHAEGNFPGGMEHQTLTLMAEFVVRNGAEYQWILAHELAHQWWGDSVTPRDWRHVWLNEGFATYCDALWREHLMGPDSLRTRMELFGSLFKLGYLQNGYAIPVYNPPSKYLFSFSTYDKGAWILHMLRHVVGDDNFFRILREYYAAHHHGTADTGDFIAACESVYGDSLGWFFDPWLNDPGLPRYRVDWTTTALEEGGTRVDVTVRQKQATAFYPLPVDFAFTTALGTTQWGFFIDQNPQTFQVTLDGPPLPGGIVLDPDGWILKTVEMGTGTPVTLLSFAASRRADGVSVAWRVPEEARRSSWRLHRQTGGARVPLGEAALAGREEYEVLDAAAPAGPVDYWLKELNPAGETAWYGPLRLAPADAPRAPVLAQNRPNPFREATTIAYTLAEPGPVRLSLFDARGRLVVRLVDGEQEAGSREVAWDGRDARGEPVAAGLYFARLETAGRSFTRKIVRAR